MSESPAKPSCSRRPYGSGGRKPLRALHFPPFPAHFHEVEMFPKDATIAGYDDELAKAIADESRRQEDHVELIASENYASPRVMEAQGSVLTNKYAEGYPGKRYYGGC